MNLKELQTEVKHWQEATFRNTSEGILNHLGREIEELAEKRNAEELADCLILLCGYAAHNGYSLQDDGDLSEERFIEMFGEMLPDIKEYESRQEVFTMVAGLFALAGMKGINLLEVAREKLAVNKARTWGEPDNEGIIEHVRNA